MEIRQLQYIIRVIELGSLSKAATALHIVQPAISRQIQKLEEELGTKLLIRDGRGVKPTRLGLEFSDRARKILHELELLISDTTSDGGEPTDDLTVGIPGIVGSEFIAELVRRFNAQYKNAKLRIVEGFSYQIVDWLQLGRVDLGIVYAPDFYTRIGVKNIVDQSLYLVGNARDADIVNANAEFADSIKLPLILPVRPNSFWDMLQPTAQQRGLQINLHMEVDSILAIRKLIKLGEGFSILPYSGVHEDIQRGELVAKQITNPVHFRQIAVAFPNRGATTLTAEKLIELVMEVAKEFVEDGKWAPK